MISQHGKPRKITHNADTIFEKALFKEMCGCYKIESHTTTVLHHQSNAGIERFYSTILEIYRVLNEQRQESKETIMNFVIYAYNNSPHSTTRKTPFEVQFGRINNMLDIADEMVLTQNDMQQHAELIKQINNEVSIRSNSNN